MSNLSDFITTGQEEVTVASIDSETAALGKILTADGSGSATWEALSMKASTVDAEASTNGQVLVSDGAGNASWSTPASGGVSTGKSIAMSIVFG